ncbi:hypothetical protein BO70DRAFT_85622 [Aspergillus heteromorphus CBS 117.55]|uniref:Nucleoporin NSP1 n=1 Tax=Aspergillus heteromorphus CBS 117.55 TaxID=1448321 RepID=A0A317X3K3_9EURO|nr:uncharacterized protein BO70DRAFT_85622 [Aspergillus heteromorphus CBS 117.55]PWY91130.1 hypothetical protein BO70DRAFT_85622 [Aspergillus heteromorphus CBS 117.55]
MSNPFSFGTAGASKPSPFGSAGATSGSSAAPGALFGNVAAPASGTSSPLFGGAGASGTTGFSFGAQNQSGAAGQTTPLFGGNSSQTPNKSEATPGSAPTATSGLFGNASNPTGGLFGNATSTPGQTGGSLFGGASSTTPAGPPPAGASGQAQPLFGQAAQKPGGLFGNLNSKTPATTSSTPPSSMTTTAPSTTPSLFPAAQQPSGGGLFGSTTPQTTFGSNPTPAAGGSLFPNTNQAAAPSTTTNGPSTLFGQAPAPAGSSSAIGSGAAQTSSLFKAPSSGADATKPAFSLTPQPATTPAASAAAPQKSLFPTLGATTSSATPSSTPAPAGGLFAGLGAAKPAATTAPAAPAASAAPAAPAAGGLFGAKPAASTPSTQPASAAPTAPTTTASDKPTMSATPGATTTTTGTTATTATGGIGLGASTAGPTPPAQSRLKNKTMDEIITRWATDLTKYQKDFRDQAEKVAEWDRMLVENGTKVQKLYGSTVDAERATQEVERQLASVEGQQEELASWLDRYEREVDEMMSKQVGPGETLQGPDQERERTYKSAEKLSERLDEMGKDLASMIEEVNSASSTLSKTNKADEPISQIVRILNTHLAQLQVIDQGTSELQAKVTAAQKAGQSLSSRFGYGLGGSTMGGSAADDFYRSYMGRR